jgi:hypothetical protein
MFVIFQLKAQMDIQPYVKKLDGTKITCDSIIVHKNGCTTFKDEEKQGYLFEKLQSFGAQRYNRFQDTTYSDQGYRFELGKKIQHDSLAKFAYNRDFQAKRNRSEMYPVLYADSRIVIVSWTQTTTQFVNRGNFTLASQGHPHQNPRVETITSDQAPRYFLLTNDEAIEITYVGTKKRLPATLNALKSALSGTGFESEVQAIIAEEKKLKQYKAYMKFLTETLRNTYYNERFIEL